MSFKTVSNSNSREKNTKEEVLAPNDKNRGAFYNKYTKQIFYKLIAENEKS